MIGGRYSHPFLSLSLEFLFLFGEIPNVLESIRKKKKKKKGEFISIEQAKRSRL